MATLPVQAPSPVGGALSAPQTAPAPGLADRWRAWVQQPQNRTALLQTGLALMQPLSLGQSPIGHIADAIGQGGEARDRYITGGQEQTKEAETRMMDQKKFGLEERQVAAQEKNVNSQVSERAKGYKSLRDFYARNAASDTDRAGTALLKMAMEAEANGPVTGDMRKAAEFLADPDWKLAAENAIRLTIGSDPLAGGGSTRSDMGLPPAPGAFQENGEWKIRVNGQTRVLKKTAP